MDLDLPFSLAIAPRLQHCVLNRCRVAVKWALLHSRCKLIGLRVRRGVGMWGNENIIVVGANTKSQGPRGRAN